MLATTDGIGAMNMLERIEAAGRVEEADVLALRRAVYGEGDGTVTAADIEAVGALLDAAPEGPDDWRWLLRECFEDHFLRQSEPRGYFTDRGEAALLAITEPRNRPNRLRTHVLVHLLDKCAAAPRSLADRAMRLLEADVLADHRICADDVAEVRRLLYAQGSLNGLGICRGEADFLFDLNDHAGENADPAWSDLFSKAITNHLLCAAGWRAPEREVALRQERWASDTAVNVGDFMRRMISFEGFGRRDRSCYWTERSEAMARHEANGERLTPGQAEWLADRLARDGRFCDAERALVAYLQGVTGAALPEVLGPYLEAA